MQIRTLTHHLEEDQRHYSSLEFVTAVALLEAANSSVWQEHGKTNLIDFMKKRSALNNLVGPLDLISPYLTLVHKR